jgi:hypothetical protein
MDLAAPYRYRAWEKQATWIHLPHFPMPENIVAHHDIRPQQQESINNDSDVLDMEENDGKEGWMCGRGVAIKTNTNNLVQCFCPPSLYGEYCQYFSDRITIIISLSNITTQLLEQQSNTIKILALLLSNDEVIDHHILHLPLVLSRELNNKFRFNLIHRRPKVLSNSYTVRFETYRLGSDSSIEFLAIWEYSVQFPFLPSYRLVQILRFEQSPTTMTAKHICITANPCLHGGTCHPIMNKIKNISAFYCHCNTYSFGNNCEHLLSSAPSVCSKSALVRRLTSSKSICLCSSHSYGPTCYLTHTCVNKNPCDIKRGKCYVNPDNIIRDYICVCDKMFFGDHCELDSAMVRFNFTDLSFVQYPSHFIMASVIQLYDLHFDTLDLIIRQQRVYQGLPPTIREIYHNGYDLPVLGIMKMYHKQQSDDYMANLKQPDYFILYSVPSYTSHVNITSVINMTNYCPYTPTVFRGNVSNLSYLSECKFSLNRLLQAIRFFITYAFSCKSKCNKFEQWI